VKGRTLNTTPVTALGCISLEYDRETLDSSGAQWLSKRNVLSLAYEIKKLKNFPWSQKKNYVGFHSQRISIFAGMRCVDDSEATDDLSFKTKEEGKSTPLATNI
jgi:hypothetical protein